jgi:hypothetical protein
MLLGILWALPMLVLRGTFITIGNSIYDPPAQELSFRNKELVLGNFLSATVVEIDLYLEVIYFVGRIAAIIFLLVFMFSFQIDQSVLLRAIILFTGGNTIILLALNVWVGKVLRRGGFRQQPQAEMPLPVPAPLAAHRI